MLRDFIRIAAGYNVAATAYLVHEDRKTCSINRRRFTFRHIDDKYSDFKYLALMPTVVFTPIPLCYVTNNVIDAVLLEYGPNSDELKTSYVKYHAEAMALNNNSLEGLIDLPIENEKNN